MNSLRYQTLNYRFRSELAPFPLTQDPVSGWCGDIRNERSIFFLVWLQKLRNSKTSGYPRRMQNVTKSSVCTIHTAVIDLSTSCFAKPLMFFRRLCCLRCSAIVTSLCTVLILSFGIMKGGAKTSRNIGVVNSFLLSTHFLISFFLSLIQS